jgi:hypothetical protein
VAANVLYIVENSHFKSGDVRSTPTLDHEGTWLVALTSADGGHIAVDGSDSSRDRSTSYYVAETCRT